MLGFFDSGVGGLSILKNTLEILPCHDYVYIGDQANFPWGEKTKEFIVARSVELTKKLLGLGAKAIVVACNTATVNAISTLRDQFRHIPFVGVEPGVKPAATGSETGKIAVLVTNATSAGDRFSELISMFAKGKDVITLPAPGLVEEVELGNIEGAELEEGLSKTLKPAIEAGADQIVLGCTHYPFLIPAIRRVVPDYVRIIDTGPPVAKQIARIVELFGVEKSKGNLAFYTSGNVWRFAELIKLFLGIDGATVTKFE